MKQRILLFTAILILVTGCKKDDKPVQHLLDTDLENASAGFWYALNDTTGFNIALTNGESHSPTHSATVSRNTAADNLISGLGQSILSDIPAGKTVILEAWIKGVNLTGKGAAIAIFCYDGNSVLQYISTEGNQSVKGTFDWTKYSVTLTNISADTQTIWVYLMYLSGTTGKVYFDDITLTSQ
jgi:hypothetical protein